MVIKILQWNIWYKENPESIAKLVRNIEPDIFCGQELKQIFEKNKKVDTSEIIAKNLGFDHYYASAESWGDSIKGRNIGNAIFSKHPIISVVNKYVQDPCPDTTDFSKEGRIYIEVQIKIAENIINVGTTHLSYSDRFLLTKQRITEANRLVSIIKDKKNNYIFTGDLNTIPNTYIINEIEKHLLNAGPNYERNTWTTKPFDYRGFKVDSLEYRLDYVFTTKDVNVLSSEIIETKYSDHLPILTTIEI